MRKDVECLFGILKLRFKILKNPFQYHSLDIMEDVFVVCGMIHNALVIVDGGWEEGVSMECTDNHGSNDLFVEEEGEDVVRKVDTETENNVISTLLNQTTTMDMNQTNEVTSEANDAWASFDSKVNALIIHYGHCYNKGELHWARKSEDGRKGFYLVGTRKVGTNCVMDREVAENVIFAVCLLIAVRLREEGSCSRAV